MRRRTSALLALPLLALPAACSSPAASAAPPQLPPGPQQSYWPGQEALTDAAEVVDDAAGRRWPGTYAGVSLDVPADVLLVHRVPTPGLDDAVRKLTPNVTVRFVDAAYSARTLDGWAERVRADTAWWQRHGVIIHSSWTDIGVCVTVEVGDPRRDAARITAHYPGMSLCVAQGFPAVPLTA